jgi:4-hydroxy-tetrahydrodipicolinate synthase
MIRLKESFLRGSYPPVITPFKDGQVDFDTFRGLLERQVQYGSHGVVIAGTTGEPSSLTLDERCELIRVAVQTVGKRIPVVAGTGSQSLAETVEITKKADQYGADAVLVVTPYYIKPPQRGLVQYFVSVAQQTHLPFLIYHIPGRASVSLQTSTVAQIVEQAPNVVGIKHASTDLEFVTDLLMRLGTEFRIFCGLESLSLPMMSIGAAGTMNAVGNLDPARVAELCEAVAANRLEAARKLHFDLLALNEAIFLDTNPIPLKYMMSRIGLLEHPELRLPLSPATKDQREKLDGVLSASGLLTGHDMGLNQPVSVRPATRLH